MSAAAASSSVGPASRQRCQACSTSSGWARPNAAGAVAGQLEARLLAEVLDPFADRGRPLRLRLIFERDTAGREDLDEGGVSSMAGRGPQRRVERLFVGVEVHGQSDGRVDPDLGRVGTKQASSRRSQVFQRQPCHRLDPVERAGGSLRRKRREQRLARRLPADPPPGADQHELAQAAGARARPGADAPASPGHDEPAQQADVDDRRTAAMGAGVTTTLPIVSGTGRLGLACAARHAHIKRRGPHHQRAGH